jgi:hypothetical protein
MNWDRQFSISDLRLERQARMDSYGAELDSDIQLILDYLSSDGWKVAANEKVVAFVWQNAFATLKIIYPYRQHSIVYRFTEGDITSFVKINYGDRLLQLLQMISADKERLHSGSYTEQLRKIIDAFPNTYYHNGSGFVLLVNQDMT